MRSKSKTPPATMLSYVGDIYTGKRPYPFPTPIIPGGSCVARVAAVGQDSTNLKPGQLSTSGSLLFLILIIHPKN